jgi:UDPglucose--hexose-1-phosphate uridylyltransferase
MFAMAYRVHRDYLADGREIIYVDDPDSLLDPERKRDFRQLPERPDSANMRQDPLTGEWISIASARQNRVFLPPAEADPLAPQTPDNPSEVPDSYDVVVFENRSPSFGPLAEALGTDQVETLARVGFGREFPAVGRCEVVCFSPDHEGSFGSLSPVRARTVLEAWAMRTESLMEMDAVEQVLVFENRGTEIGVTLAHPHGQIYAYPFVAPRTAKLLQSVTEVGDDFFVKLLESEKAGPRVVARTPAFTAFVPFAARWPLELHILPHRQVATIADLSAAERDELAPLYLELVRCFDRLYDTPTPYIAAWHQAPKSAPPDTVRLMVQITSPRRSADKLKYLAGSESAMGAFIGDVSPEDQAQAFRSVLAKDFR